MAEAPLRVVHQFRHSGISIERLFTQIARSMPARYAVDTWFAPYGRANFKSIVGNLRAARGAGGAITHVTGQDHYFVLALPRATTVLTVHDCVGVQHLRGLRRWIYRTFWLKLPVARAAAVTAISQRTKDELVALTGCDPAKIEIIENCVFDEFQPHPRPFNAERPRVLQVGTTWNKNVAGVAAALRGIDCELRIIGRDISETDRQALADNQIRHVHLGGISDAEVIKEYIACDVIAFASKYEGFGLPIIEGQAVGRPVVTSDLDPMRGVAGGAAALVDPADPASIRAAFGRVFTDAAYRDDLVARGLQNVERFRPAAIAARYAAVYDRVLANVNRSSARVFLTFVNSYFAFFSSV